jgi:hypothetical protein
VHEIYDFGTQKGFFLEMKKKTFKNQQHFLEPVLSFFFFFSHDFVVLVVVQAGGDVQRNVESRIQN